MDFAVFYMAGNKHCYSIDAIHSSIIECILITILYIGPPIAAVIPSLNFLLWSDSYGNH